MKLSSFKFSTSIILFIFGLSACGGGGGGGGGAATAPPGKVTSTLAFPLLAGYKAMVAAGYSKTFTISGDCSGSGSTTRAPVSTATTFEGSPALSGGVTLTWTLTNCTPTSLASTYTAYYDSNYLPLGSSNGVDSYNLYLTPPSIPASVMVGATAASGTLTGYTTSAKSVFTGTQVVSFLIEPDTATTAIVNVISKGYNSSTTLLYTGQDRFRMTSSGTLTILSSDIQYATGSAIHLVLTYN